MLDNLLNVVCRVVLKWGRKSHVRADAYFTLPLPHIHVSFPSPSMNALYIRSTFLRCLVKMSLALVLLL